ncbi:acyl-CoA synthetase [Polymorphobacter glacialis]|uniref:Acyl-CoA synthetase n=1 Tax=Sandarakinorhabdus glacialis TaxID=1614636 RepID=A0A916ZJ11_9SPHN|nr:AMP-binding protein [Polymorphobacter glacialis]GGE00597.1 acyl-CoA synthetase [Polymorphobacter glacialis]
MTELHPAAHIVSPIINAMIRDRDRPIVEMAGGRAWTGGEMLEATSRLTQALQAQGVKSGARVALLAGNSVEVLLLHNAIAFAGGCLVAMHPMGSADDHLFAIEDADVEVLIYDPANFAARAGELRARTNRLKTALSFGPDAESTDLLALSETYPPGALTAPLLDPGNITRLSYSGGTTGKPKAIPGNPRTAAAALQIMLSEWEWPIEPRILAAVPLSHAGGALFGPMLLKNGSMVVLPYFEPGAVLAAIEKYRITCTMLVPTMIYALPDHPDFDKYDIFGLETIFYGASLMSPVRLKEAIERIGPVFFQFYGQAEAPMTVCVMRRSEHDANNPDRLASCGRPVPYVDVALLGDDNQPVPDGEPGEICVRGPLVMDGYMDRADQNLEALSGGWLHTGDVAVKDLDGFLRIVDRKKDMIVTGGFNVFPSEVENVIASHPAVAQVSVFGIADEKWGEAVRAAVVLRPGASVEPAVLIALVREHKGPVQAPEAIDFVDAIPQTAVGKPDKKALRARFAA